MSSDVRHLKTKKVFDIPGISPDMMQLIVEFAHTGSVSVTEENVRELLLAAKQLKVAHIVQTCVDVLLMSRTVHHPV